MPLVDKENVLAAQLMYVDRIEFLRAEVSRVVNRGIQLGDDYEAETMFALDVIEDELKGIDDCLAVLKHLLWN